MTRLQALRELASKVEAGDENRFAHSFLDEVRSWRSPLEYFEITNLVHRAYHGSLDAAQALHGAVLPGLPVQITDMSQDYLGSQGWSVAINWPHVEWKPTFTAAGPFSHTGQDDDPARSWLLAILRELIAQEEADK